ncbi:MAG: hypothetical protein RR288_04930 [Oscillibacter sp.]
MALFVDKNKRRKSPLVMICFCVSLAFLCVYGGAYALLTEPLYLHLTLKNVVATTVVHAVIMAAAGTAVCCLLFFLPDKRIVPGAYLCLAALLAVFYLAVFLLERENRGDMLRLISLFGLAPVLLGNAAAWPIYWKIRGAQTAPTQIKTLREELREAAAKAPKKAPAMPAVPEKPVELAPSPDSSVPTEEEALFGPEAGENPAAFRSAQEEAMLFYEDEESDH